MLWRGTGGCSVQNLGSPPGRNGLTGKPVKACLGATLAGQAFANSPVAAVHVPGLSAGRPSRATRAFQCPGCRPVLRFNAKAAASLYAELADVLGVFRVKGMRQPVRAFVQHMETLMDESSAAASARCRRDGQHARHACVRRNETELSVGQ